MGHHTITVSALFTIAHCIAMFYKYSTFLSHFKEIIINNLVHVLYVRMIHKFKFCEVTYIELLVVQKGNLCSSITILLDGFIVIWCSYKPHIPTCSQVYMCNFIPVGIFDVWCYHSIYTHTHTHIHIFNSNTIGKSNLLDMYVYMWLSERKPA